MVQKGSLYLTVILMIANQRKEMLLINEKAFVKGLEPERIISATDSTGELMFLMERIQMRQIWCWQKRQV